MENKIGNFISWTSCTSFHKVLRKYASFPLYAAVYNHILFVFISAFTEIMEAQQGLLSGVPAIMQINGSFHFSTSLPFIVVYTCSSFSPKPNIIDVLEITSGRISLACFSTCRDWSKLARGSRTFLENSRDLVSKNNKLN